MTGPDTQPQGETRTLAQQLRACADAVTTAALLDRRHIVAATLRDLADRAAETELRADRAENARDQVGEMLHAAQEQRNQVSARWHEERKHAAEAEQQRDLLRGTLTVIRMIVEESATNDAGLLRQAILEQLPASPGVGPPQPAPQRHADAPATAPATTETQPDAQEPQEAAEPLVHAELTIAVGPNRGQGTGYALCDNGDGTYPGGTLAHSSWQVNCGKCLAWPDEPPADTGYRAIRREQHPEGGPSAVRPICPDCELPETNCACG